MWYEIKDDKLDANWTMVAHKMLIVQFKMKRISINDARAMTYTQMHVRLIQFLWVYARARVCVYSISYIVWSICWMNIIRDFRGRTRILIAVVHFNVIWIKWMSGFSRCASTYLLLHIQTVDSNCDAKIILNNMCVPKRKPYESTIYSMWYGKSSDTQTWQK